MYKDLEERDAAGNLTDWALACDALSDHGCDCGEGDAGTCLPCLCERAMKAERSKLQDAKGRLRTTAQILIQKTGAEGPISAEEAAGKAVSIIREQRAEIQSSGQVTGDALDEIARLCGCPEWNYPGQLVRDVKQLLEERCSARAIARVLAHAWEGDNRPPQQMVKEALGYPINVDTFNRRLPE